MAMVRFATTCDYDVFQPGMRHCNARSEEYTAWPSCRECQLDVCPAHTAPGTRHENDGRDTVLCIACAESVVQESVSG